MSQETLNPYRDRTITVVGGEGALGSKIAINLQTLGFRAVEVCERGDPFLDFVRRSNDLFFAVDNKEIAAMLEAARDILKPGHSILDGSSVKEPLIPVYRGLDERQISVCSTHLGAVPAQPWRGIKVWVCEVGANSQKAKQLACDLFLSTNSSIRVISIDEHTNVERDQWITMATAHIVAGALRQTDFPLARFDDFATLNAELMALPIGRTLGQGTVIPSEVLFNQPLKWEWLEGLEKGIKALKRTLKNREKLQKFMQENIDFHDDPGGFIDSIFRKAGIIGARNANLRMHKFSFRIIDDQPGKLMLILQPFHIEGANLTAIDSMPGVINEEERKRGINPDAIVDFDIGIDPKTIDEEKELRIRKRLLELGCIVG